MTKSSKHKTVYKRWIFSSPVHDMAHNDEDASYRDWFSASHSTLSHSLDHNQPTQNINVYTIAEQIFFLKYGTRLNPFRSLPWILLFLGNTINRRIWFFLSLIFWGIILTQCSSFLRDSRRYSMWPLSFRVACQIHNGTLQNFIRATNKPIFYFVFEFTLIKTLKRGTINFFGKKTDIFVSFFRQQIEITLIAPLQKE